MCMLGLYKEMRELEGDTLVKTFFHRNVNYIIIGFKSTDEKYNRVRFCCIPTNLSSAE